MSRLLSFAPAFALSVGLAMAAPLSLAAQSLDVSKMTEDERSAFRAEIRAYLLDNPEVIFEAVEVMEQRKAEAQENLDLALVEMNADAIRDDGFSWVGGNPDGDITIVEFLDYRCGYCRKAYDDVAELIESDGNIRFVVKEYPILSEESVTAARFAIATRQVAGDAAYSDVHDALMAFNGSPDATALTRLADSLGLDPAPILAAMPSDAVTQEITETRALAQRLQVNGTPTFVIGSQMLRGYAPLDAMRQIVEGERSDG